MTSPEKKAQQNYKKDFINKYAYMMDNGMIAMFWNLKYDQLEIENISKLFKRAEEAKCHRDTSA